MVDLAASDNYIRDPALSASCRRAWEGTEVDGGLVSEVWVEGAFPAQIARTPDGTPQTLERLVRDGAFPGDLCAHLQKRECWPTDRPLFSHQHAAIFASAHHQAPRPSLVITAPTGAGKTEAFLLPILADLWSQKTPRRGGMRCLILYPMNALVTDQVERLYHWLCGQTDLRVFHFTSETPEHTREAIRSGEPQWEPCRCRTRQEARGLENHQGQSISPPLLPPDIVITNYSMLEYMLCRPQDACFFGPDLRAIVLDEAHLYSGTLAADISLLLTRVRLRCEVNSEDVLHLATSATLGGDARELALFAGDLFSRETSTVTVIEGRSAPLRFAASASPHPIATGSERLATHAELELTTLTADDDFVRDAGAQVGQLRSLLTEVVAEDALARAATENPDVVAPFLRAALETAPVAQRLASELFRQGLIGLNALAAAVWGAACAETVKATTLLLRLCATARRTPDALPLIPHRLHFLVRGPESMSCCLNATCSGPAEFRIAGAGCIATSADCCPFCGFLALPLHRCDTCGEWALVAFTNSKDGILEPGYFVAPSQRCFYLLVRPAGEPLIGIRVNPETGEFDGDSAAGTLLHKAPCPIHRGTCRDPSSCNQQECPSCHRPWATASDEDDEPSFDRNCLPIRSGDRLGIAVVAETVLHGLPRLGGDSARWKPAEGRRLLCFSDSRKEAARLGPHLTSQHEVWIVRSALSRILGGLPLAESLAYYRREVERYEADLVDPTLTGASHVAVQRKLNDARKDLQAAESGISFVDLAELFGKDPIIREILHPEQGDAHRADQWKESTWNENARAVSGHAQALIARELDSGSRTRISLESLGLAEVCYPGLSRFTAPDTLLGVLPQQAIRTGMADIWPDLVAALLDTLRGARCLAWSEETAGRTWEGESPLWARWTARDRGGWNAVAFVGDISRPLARRQNRLRFARDVLRRLGCSDGQADELAPVMLHAVFDQLAARAAAPDNQLSWLAAKDAHQLSHDATSVAIQLRLDQLAVRPPRQLFLCPDTGTLWCRSVLGHAPLRGCSGGLRVIATSEVDSHPRWGRPRREIRESPIFRMGLWSEEHSAQLDASENKRRQLLFKDGARNILSSTTTMELGIDVGGLNGVLMGNVPPARANHLQRAGRAGRRSDGSAVVVTFARERAFDREVFRRFRDFMAMPFRRPTAFLDRDRLTRRHVHALLLGEFFAVQQLGTSGAMQAYGDMGRFCGLEAPAKWSEQRRKPEWNPSGTRIAQLFISFLATVQPEEARIRVFVRVLTSTSDALKHVTNANIAWKEFLAATAMQFDDAVKAWDEDVRLLRDAWLDIKPEPSDPELAATRAHANAIRYQIDARCRLSVIEWLAGRGFLPRYGFPINLQHLLVRVPKTSASGQSSTDERYRLERPANLALNEYVPGAEIVIGGNVVKSRGILKHWTDANRDHALGLQYRAFRCETYGHLYLRSSTDHTCPECGSAPAPGSKGLLFPRFGYTTAAWDPPTRGGMTTRVGEVEAYPADIGTSEVEQLAGRSVRVLSNFGAVQGLSVEYREEAELLIHNEGKNKFGFAVCTRCGFAESEEKPDRQGQEELPRDFKAHAPVFRSRADRSCWPKTAKDAPVLRNKVLAARERADMLLFDWPDVGVTDSDGLFSVGRALLRAGCRKLEIDARELEVRVKPLRDGRPGLLLYETVAGGAGHCQELIAMDRQLLIAARDLLRGSTDHQTRCKRACIECLLDFAGQFHAKRLDRIHALDILDIALV